MHRFVNNAFIEMKSSSFSYNEDWELECFYQAYSGFMFVGYLNKHKIFYAYKIESNTWSDTTIIYNGFFDFKWTARPIDSLKRDFPMKMIVYDDNNIYLKGTLFTIQAPNINRKDLYSIKIINGLNFSNAFFDNDNDYFYFITFDKDPPEFQSGYNNKKSSFNYNQVESISNLINVNNESPLDFFYNFTIKKMSFARNTKYVFYELYNTIENF
jgi:hypothetical protein